MNGVKKLLPFLTALLGGTIARAGSQERATSYSGDL
jgi:hypothetical protein